MGSHGLHGLGGAVEGAQAGVRAAIYPAELAELSHNYFCV